MADGSVRRNVTDDASDAVRAETSESSDDALPNYGPWVSFYGFLHRFFGRRRFVFGQQLVFAGVILAGALVVLRYGFALGAGTVEEPVLSAGVAVVGALLSALGVGYFVVRLDTSCDECGTAFSKERVGKRFVRREVRGRDRTFVAETVECRECDDRTTEIYAHPEQQSPRW